MALSIGTLYNSFYFGVSEVSANFRLLLNAHHCTYSIRTVVLGQDPFLSAKGQVQDGKSSSSREAGWRWGCVYVDNASFLVLEQSETRVCCYVQADSRLQMTVL